MEQLTPFIVMYASSLPIQLSLFLLVMMFVGIGCACTKIENDGTLKPFARFVTHSLTVFFIFHYILLRSSLLYTMPLGQVLCLAGIAGVFGNTIIKKGRGIIGGAINGNQQG